jgi:hypothetical protein
MRYYGYLGTSSTAKSAVLTATEFSDGSPGSWPMDSRLKSQDNFTVTGQAVNLGAGDGSTTHLIICPGNEAGDATSCASAAINDRGLGTAVAGISGDNASYALLLSATSNNDFQALRLETTNRVTLSAVTVAYDGSTGATKVAATTDGTATSAVLDSNSTALKNVMNTSVTTGFVCGVGDNTSVVTVIPVSSSTLGTAKVNHFPGLAVNNVVCSTGGSTTLAMVYETDNLSVYSVGTDGTLTLWNDNITTSANLREDQPIAFAVHPDGTRAAVVGWYDNASIFPQIISMTTLAATRTALDNGSHNREAEATDNGTIFSVAAWANDGTAGGALWVSLSVDNATGGYQMLKFTDNGTAVSTWSKHAAGTGAASADNISSMSIAIDNDDYLPVVAIGSDVANGDIQVFKYDNSTSTMTELKSTDDANSAGMPISIAGSADGSTFAIGYVATSGDNATVQIFYDE